MCMVCIFVHVVFVCMPMGGRVCVCAYDAYLWYVCVFVSMWCVCGICVSVWCVSVLCVSVWYVEYMVYV